MVCQSRIIKFGTELCKGVLVSVFTVACGVTSKSYCVGGEEHVPKYIKTEVGSQES